MTHFSRRHAASALALALALFAGSALAAPPGVRHVRADAPAGGDGLTWATAYNDLRQALLTAGSSGGAITELWVKEGTYLPAPAGSTDRTRNFTLAPDVGAYGGFAGTETQRDQRDPAAHSTILSGQLASTTFVYNVVVGAGNAGTILDGFTITRGIASQTVTSGTGWTGGGIHITGGSPAIRNCLITNNGAGAGLQEAIFRMGGGVYCDGGSAATFTDCTFDSNRTGISKYTSGISAGAGAGLAANQCSITLTRCAFTGNITGEGGYTICAGGSPLGGNDGGDGAGLALFSAAALIRDCVFTANQTGTATKSDICSSGGVPGRAGGDGGAIYASQSVAVIINSLFADNHAANGGPGGDRFTTTGTSGGRGGSGGAIWSAGGEIDIVNCTMVANTKGQGGPGGMSAGGPGPTGAPGTGSGVFGDNLTRLENGISWNDGVSEIVGATASYSDIRGGYPGTGNINADPLFRGSASGDYRIQSTSPCIDAANSFPSATTLPATDLDGLTRRVDVPGVADTGVGAPVVDMGAYEVQFCTVDLTGDGLVDFSDYLEFLNLFDAGDLRVDFTGDGIVDFSDYLEFLNLFDAGC